MMTATTGSSVNEAIGYVGRILWIDLSAKTWHMEDRDEGFWRRYVGGGLLATALLLEKCTPGIDPLGPENLLVFASSVAAGHAAPGLARFTTAAKSPLTNGIGETRTEGPWGVALKAVGATAVVIQGRAAQPVLIVIENGNVRFLPAADMWGLMTGEVTDRLEETLGKDIHVAAIGPAGERQVRFASIVTDRTFQVSRMGMGAVMGAKNLKALVLSGGQPPPVADPAALDRLGRSFAARMRRNDLSRWQLDPPGFSCWLYLHGLDAALCVNNYSLPIIEGIERFKADEFLKRYRGECPCPGCPNQCIKTMHPTDRDGLDLRASGIHQEVTGTMGPNLGIVDLDWIVAANNFCNQNGLDPTSFGFTLAFAMELYEKDILTSKDGPPVRFGDRAGARQLMDDVVQRRGLGDVLAEGTLRAARRLGRDAARYAMQVKGLEMVCFEPRSQTNLALGYAVAPIGPRYDICEHDWDFDTKVGWEHSLNLARTLGILERIPMNSLEAHKVRNFKALHTLWSAADALDFCIFAVAPTRLLSLPEMAALLAAVTGWETSDYEIMRLGERRLHLMRAYNLREGLSAAADTLPDRFFEEPVATGPRQGDVLDRAAFHANVRTYYRMMGWTDSGQPTPETLADHGLFELCAARVPGTN